MGGLLSVGEEEAATIDQRRKPVNAPVYVAGRRVICLTRVVSFAQGIDSLGGPIAQIVSPLGYSQLFALSSLPIELFCRILLAYSSLPCFVHGVSCDDNRENTNNDAQNTNNHFARHNTVNLTRVTAR